MLVVYDTLSLTFLFALFLQVQDWFDNSLPPTEWGWVEQDGGQLLLPVPCLRAPAPEFILKLVRCGCQKGCERNCECRRAGLPCTVMCAHCSGVDCSNPERAPENSQEDNPDDPEVPV